MALPMALFARVKLEQLSNCYGTLGQSLFSLVSLHSVLSCSYRIQMIYSALPLSAPSHPHPGRDPMSYLLLSSLPLRESVGLWAPWPLRSHGRMGCIQSSLVLAFVTCLPSEDI